MVSINLEGIKTAPFLARKREILLVTFFFTFSFVRNPPGLKNVKKRVKLSVVSPAKSYTYIWLNFIIEWGLFKLSLVNAELQKEEYIRYGFSNDLP